MKKRIPSVHSKSHEDRAYHPGRSVGRSALELALDPFSGYSESAAGRNDAWQGYEGAITTEEDTYDMGGGPMDLTRRNRGVEWEPTEYEQEQSRSERDQMLDAVTGFFKKPELDDESLSYLNKLDKDQKASPLWKGTK